MVKKETRSAFIRNLPYMPVTCRKRDNKTQINALNVPRFTEEPLPAQECIAQTMADKFLSY